MSKFEEALKMDQEKLNSLQVGSKEWLNLYETIELGKELKRNGEIL